MHASPFKKISQSKTPLLQYHNHTQKQGCYLSAACHGKRILLYGISYDFLTHNNSSLKLREFGNILDIYQISLCKTKNSQTKKPLYIKGSVI